jgi:hypothetical protein
MRRPQSGLLELMVLLSKAMHVVEKTHLSFPGRCLGLAPEVRSCKFVRHAAACGGLKGGTTMAKQASAATRH